MPKHKWKFKSCFRSEMYGWNGTAKASKRMKEAVSEIKKVAKTDSSLAGEGVVELFVRLYPALMNIDGSSGSLGNAIHYTVTSLVPILIDADWDIITRSKYLDQLYQAIVDDGWGTFDELRDKWGEICVYPELANIWADRFIPTLKKIWTSPEYSSYTGTDMCLSCLVFTERYEELENLLKLREKKLWFNHMFWAMALVKQGKPDEALEYARMIQAEQKNQDYEIDMFCEDLLIEMRRIEEAYLQYGLELLDFGGTYLNKFRSICKKYPSIDKQRILTDCIERSGNKGKWFAAAKSIGCLDIALECAEDSSSDPSTLLRAANEYSQKDADFALQVGIWAIIWLVTGDFYDKVTATDVTISYQTVEKVALENDKLDKFKTELAGKMSTHSHLCKDDLREVVMKKLKM